MPVQSSKEILTHLLPKQKVSTANLLQSMNRGTSLQKDGQGESDFCRTVTVNSFFTVITEHQAGLICPQIFPPPSLIPQSGPSSPWGYGCWMNWHLISTWLGCLEGSHLLLDVDVLLHQPPPLPLPLAGEGRTRDTKSHHWHSQTNCSSWCPSPAHTYQLQVFCRLLVQVVCQVFIKACQVLHLHLNPVLPQVVMPFELISETQWGKGDKWGGERMRDRHLRHCCYVLQYFMLYFYCIVFCLYNPRAVLCHYHAYVRSLLWL